MCRQRDCLEFAWQANVEMLTIPVVRACMLTVLHPVGNAHAADVPSCTDALRIGAAIDQTIPGAIHSVYAPLQAPVLSHALQQCWA